MLDARSLYTVAALRAGAPITAAHHAAERACGWPGANGSTWSTDRICGVVCGRTSPKHYPGDPFYVHDFLYRVIRRELAWGGIDHVSALELKAIADLRMLHALQIKMCAELVGRRAIWLQIALWRCRARYDAVSRFGFTSIVPFAGEGYVRPAPRTSAFKRANEAVLFDVPNAGTLDVA